MGVRVLACQQVIHETVQQRCLQLGMLPLQRLSAIHIHHVAALTGALPISSTAPSPAWRACLGLLGSAALRRVGHKDLLALTPPHKSQPQMGTQTKTQTGPQPQPQPQLQPQPQPPPPPQLTPLIGTQLQAGGAHGVAPRAAARACPRHTLLLGADCELQAEELVPAVEGALRTLATLARHPGVLPGGGCGEALLASHVRARAAADVRARERAAAASAAANSTAAAGAAAAIPNTAADAAAGGAAATTAAAAGPRAGPADVNSGGGASRALPRLQVGALEAVACALEAVATSLAAPAYGGGDDRGAVADAVASLSLHVEDQLRAPVVVDRQGATQGRGEEGLLEVGTGGGRVEGAGVEGEGRERPSAASPGGCCGGGGTAQHAQHAQDNTARVEYVGWDADAGLFGPVASAVLPHGWGVSPPRPKQTAAPGTSTSTVPSSARQPPSRAPHCSCSLPVACLPVGSDARVLDAAAVKLGAVLAALEAAVTLLRIDGVVSACP
ncbi:hypothetical protein FOA52_000594 [Chlamydomonas sp. UWO 241]|nr:hypothetical protein FOA52_000594 [Chlamydomonas sp. UWO 241]